MIPIGKARIVRSGGHVTIVSWSNGMTYALKAADELAKEGIEAEVIDLRTLRPMDTDTIVASVKKTGRAVTVEEGWQQSGVGAEIAARIMEHAFDYLDAPVARVSGKDVPMPYAANLEKLALPSVAEVVASRQSRLVIGERHGRSEGAAIAARRRWAARTPPRCCAPSSSMAGFRSRSSAPSRSRICGACCWSTSRAMPRAPMRARATITEEDALARIIDMFEAEIARPTDMGIYHAAVATGSLTMPINILMPALSPTMEKGNLAKWLKKEGDKVKSGDVIAEIETDKATMEVEAVDEGTIAKILVPEGTQDVPVNDVIAVLAGDGEDVKAAGAGAAARRRRPLQRRSLRRLPRRGTGSRACAASCESAGTARRRCRAASRAPAPQANGHARIFSSPLARRLAKEAGIELAPHQRLRPARPRHRARRRGRQIRQGPEGAGRRARRRAEHRAGDVGQADPRAVRAGHLRGRPA